MIQFDNPYTLLIDFAIITLIEILYFYHWRGAEPSVDLNTYLESVKASLTAASILLPGGFLAANTVSASGTSLIQPSPIGVLISSLLLALSVLSGVVLLFALPTTVGSHTGDDDSRIVLNKQWMIHFGIFQLSCLGVGSVRLFISFLA